MSQEGWGMGSWQDPGVFVLGLGFASGPKTAGFRCLTQHKGVLPADLASLVGQATRGYGFKTEA